MNWEEVIVEAAWTDTGMRRANNQDSYAVVRAPGQDAWKNRGHLFMVADGMGAHAVGELASKLACDNIPHSYTKSKTGPPEDALTKAYKAVNAQIHAKAKANPDFKGMGTTCSTLVLLPAGALIAHVGDSRIYRARDGRLDQLTCDHSLIWDLIARGHVEAAQAANAPKNVITRSLGPDPEIEVDIEGPFPATRGDVYIICSDGLSGPVSDPEIGAIAANLEPERAARTLTHLANLRGGADNISVIVARVGPWVEPGSEAHAPDAGTGKRKGSLLGGLLGSLRGRSAAPEAEAEPYRTAECPIDRKLVARMGESVRVAHEIAVEQSWSLDWVDLTARQAAAKAAYADEDFPRAFGEISEAVALLGYAGRLHRKASTRVSPDP